jgi:hypothetical protein
LSARSGLETRGLDALTREKAVDGLAVDAKNAPHTHGVEAAVVDEAPDRLRVHAELRRDLADADETSGLSIYGRHNPSEALQVPSDAAWAGWTISPAAQGLTRLAAKARKQAEARQRLL